jgi:hypothetical protein
VRVGRGRRAHPEQELLRGRREPAGLVGAEAVLAGENESRATGQPARVDHTIVMSTSRYDCAAGSLLANPLVSCHKADAAWSRSMKDRSSGGQIASSALRRLAPQPSSSSNAQWPRLVTGAEGGDTHSLPDLHPVRYRRTQPGEYRGTATTAGAA